MMTLNQLATGQSASIATVPEALMGLKHRCMTLGITAGSTVEVLRRAPGKGPLQIKVLNTLYAIRPNDAMHIQVTPL